jgi:AmmeMemoRadiSam system protein B/AmmeMemoRadiSam system protein A
MKTVLTILTTMMMMNMCNGQIAKEPVVRPATQANRFYTGDAGELSKEVDSLLMLHRCETVYRDVAALIVPHAGYYFSGNVAAAAYMSVPRDKQYKRIFLLGPSHHEWLDGASVNTEADYYATPLGQVKVDRETAVALTAADSVFRYEPKAHDREHCLEVQLPFLQRFFTIHSSLFTKDVPPIVPIIISTNDFQKLKRIAEALKPYLTEENLFIVSSDFSHYPKYEDACRVDARTGKAVESGDVEQFIAALEENARSGVPGLATSACGELAIATLLMMIDSTYEVKHLMYQNSGDAEESDHSRVVGYHAFAIVRNGQARTDTDFSLTDDEKRMLKEIAMTSIKDSLNGRGIAVANSSLFTLHSSLKQKCGAFVSLHKHGRLRGCIGHFGEDMPLHEIVAEMARAAAFEDPRFMPVTADELADIDIEISVLTPMRRIQSLDEFELHRHGIYIRKGYRSWTYLPQVADEVNWTKEEFVSHCAQDKAGIGWDGWKDAELYVYEAIVF